MLPFSNTKMLSYSMAYISARDFFITTGKPVETASTIEIEDKPGHTAISLAL